MMNSISLTNEELAVLPRASVCETPNKFSNGSIMFFTSLPINMRVHNRFGGMRDLAYFWG